MYLSTARPLAHLRPDPAHDYRTFFPYIPNEVKHRRRTTRTQLKMLEAVFASDPKPNNLVRTRLSHDLQMTPRAVQVWFQNRRAKQKALEKKGHPAVQAGDARTDDPTADDDDSAYGELPELGGDEPDHGDGATSISHTQIHPLADSSELLHRLHRISPSPSGVNISRFSWHHRTHSGSSPASSSSSPIVSVPGDGYSIPPSQQHQSYLSPIPSGGQSSFESLPLDHPASGPAYARRGSMPNVALPRGDANDLLARRGSMDHMRNRLIAHPYAHVALAASNAAYPGGRRASTNLLYGHGHGPVVYGHSHGSLHPHASSLQQGMYTRRPSPGHLIGQTLGPVGTGNLYASGTGAPMMHATRSAPRLSTQVHRPPLHHQPHTVPMEHTHQMQDSVNTSASSTPTPPLSSLPPPSSLDPYSGPQIPLQALSAPVRSLPLPSMDGPLPESGYTFGAPSNGAASASGSGSGSGSAATSPHPDTQPNYPQQLGLHPHGQLYHTHGSIPGGASGSVQHSGTLSEQLHAFTFPPSDHPQQFRPAPHHHQRVVEPEFDDTTTTASGSAASFLSSRFGSIGSIAGSESSATSAFLSSAGSLGGGADMDGTDKCYQSDMRRGSFASNQFPELFSSLNVNTSSSSLSQAGGMPTSNGVNTRPHIPTAPQDQEHGAIMTHNQPSKSVGAMGSNEYLQTANIDTRNGSVGSVGTVVGDFSSPGSTASAGSNRQTSASEPDRSVAAAGQTTLSVSVPGHSTTKDQILFDFTPPTPVMNGHDGGPLVFRHSPSKALPEYDDRAYVSGTGHYSPVAATMYHPPQDQELQSMNSQQQYAHHHLKVEFGGQGQEVLQLHHAMEYGDPSFTAATLLEAFNASNLSMGGGLGGNAQSSTHSTAPYLPSHGTGNEVYPSLSYGLHQLDPDTQYIYYG